MAYERKWLRVEAQFFVSNGGADGTIVLASTSGFKVKQKVKVTAIGMSPVVLEVKRVLSPTTLLVGPINTGINTRIDLSGFTTDKLPTITAEEQEKNGITREDREAAVYEQEPTVAKRVVLVDEWGNFYKDINPLPVSIDEEVEIIGATTPLIQRIDAVTAGTEYDLTLPIGTRQFTIANVKEGRLQIAYISGESGGNFMTIKPGNTYKVNDMLLKAPLTVYFQSNKNNQEIELVSWS